MINLNRIRSIKALETIRKTLADFLSNPDVPEVYKTEFGWNEDDYSVDRDLATELLEKVNRRIDSLSRHLNKLKESESKPVD